MVLWRCPGTTPPTKIWSTETKLMHCKQWNNNVVFSSGACVNGLTWKVSWHSLPKAKKYPRSEPHREGCSVLAADSAHPARWRANHSNSLQPDPCISPACVDTMQNGKLCISLDLSVTLLFAYSICHAPFMILFKSQHVGAYCTQTLQKFKKLSAVT